MESDPLLRRLEWDAVRACGLMALLALAWRRGQPDVALAVVAGGVLAAISYRGIKGGVDALVTTVLEREGAARPARSWALVKFFTRYAILALVAYLVVVRLRLHPIGIVAGASSVVVAAAVEAVRIARRPLHSGNPR